MMTHEADSGRRRPQPSREIPPRTPPGSATNRHKSVPRPPSPPNWLEVMLVRIGKYPATVGYIAIMTTLIFVMVLVQALV